MSIARKIALSLLITVLLSAGFALISFTALFDFLQLRFYDPAKLSSIRHELNDTSRIIQQSLGKLQIEFQSALDTPAVKRSFALTQTNEDILERSQVFGRILASAAGLQYVRFVDTEGLRIHYSTEPGDILVFEAGKVAYKNYYEVAGSIPLSAKMTQEKIEPEIRFEGEGERVVFYFPFYDSFEVYIGIAIFSVSSRSIIDSLAGETGINISDSIAVISNPRGIVVTGIHDINITELKEKIAALWMSNVYVNKLNTLADSSGNSFILISERTTQDIFIGRIFREHIFEFSALLKSLMLTSCALTIFVILFLLFNVKQDPVLIVQNRLKSLQVRLIEEYYDIKGNIDWNKWRWELEQRREDLRRELRHGVKIKPGSEIDVYIDSFFNKSWDDLLTAVGQRGGVPVQEDARLEDMLKRILDAAGSLLPVRAAGEIPPNLLQEEPPPPAELPNEPDDIEDLESAGELEPLEEDENAGLAFACAGAPLADTGIHARKTVFTENTAWAELEKQDRKRQIETAREELAGAIMKGIRTRRETEKAEAAYDTLPEILENDPMPEMAGDNGHSNTADTDSSPLAYGILEADSGAEEEIPELLEALEESEAAGQSELELARMDYGTWIPDSLPPPESPAETPPSSDSAPPPSGSLPTDKPAVETPPFAQNLPPLNELATVPFEEADIPDEYYDVEEFEEVTEEDMANAAFKPIDGPIYTFETPHKGTDINEIAKEIDTAPLPEQTDNSAFFDDKFDMDVTSPVDYMFAKDIVPAKEKVSAKLNQPDDTIITEKDGVNYIRTGMLKNAYGGVEVDLRFKSLVDDVLS